MYRTSYTDATHFREVHVKSDFPAGYGGHIPSMRHDVFFRNTEFDRKHAMTRNDPSRDAFPSFIDQIAGVPTYTTFPQGARKNPTYRVVPHDGTTTGGRPPWAMTKAPRAGLNYRNTPDTIIRSRSSPSLQQAGSSRVNELGFGSGAQAAPSLNFERQPRSPMGEDPSNGMESPQLDRLKRSVSRANEKAMYGRAPTEAEVLGDNVQ